MEQLKTYFAQGMRFYKEHEKPIRTAVILLTVIAAVLLFAGYGEEEEILVNSSDDGDAAFALSAGSADGAAETEQKQEEPARLYVDITGEVKHPGVYEMEEGARVFDVIEEAGGLLASAETAQLNRAEPVSDGQKIIVPKKGENGTNSGLTVGLTADGRININTADSAVLQEIPGVGPATAEKIIAYRTENGRFEKKEELMNVSGIGEKTFEKLKDRITV